MRKQCAKLCMLHVMQRKTPEGLLILVSEVWLQIDRYLVYPICLMIVGNYVLRCDSISTELSCCFLQWILYVVLIVNEFQESDCVPRSQLIISRVLLVKRRFSV